MHMFMLMFAAVTVNEKSMLAQQKTKLAYQRVSCGKYGWKRPLILVFAKICAASNCRLKHQRHAVITPALACRLRAVFEYMTMMTAAFSAVVFGAWVDKFEVGFFIKRTR